MIYNIVMYSQKAKLEQFSIKFDVLYSKESNWCLGEYSALLVVEHCLQRFGGKSDFHRVRKGNVRTVLLTRRLGISSQG